MYICTHNLYFLCTPSISSKGSPLSHTTPNKYELEVVNELKNDLVVTIQIPA